MPLKIQFFGEISNNRPNDLFRINVYKTLKLPFLPLVTLFSVLPSKLIVPGVERSKNI